MAPRAYSSSIRDAQVEQTRAHLLDTARALLAEGGLDALTLPKLAQAAGVSVPTVYRHFPTIDDLTRAFLEWLRPRVGQTLERQLPEDCNRLPELPLENYPRYEAEAALLRPLMDSREFNRVRVASQQDRAQQARKVLRPHAPGWSDAELEALSGAVWTFAAPQAWRWLRDTWSLDNEAAAHAASWAMRTLLEALARGPGAQEAKPAAKPTTKSTTKPKAKPGPRRKR